MDSENLRKKVSICLEAASNLMSKYDQLNNRITDLETAKEMESHCTGECQHHYNQSKHPGTKTCNTCHGLGRVVIEDDSRGEADEWFYIDCPRCHGEGFF